MMIWDDAMGAMRPLRTSDLSDTGGGGGASTADRELIVTTYRCKAAFSGGSVDDIITAAQIIDVSAAPATVGTVWRNQTTGADISQPAQSSLEALGTRGLTAQELAAAGLATESSLSALIGSNAAMAAGTGTADYSIVNPATPAELASMGTLTLGAGAFATLQRMSDGRAALCISHSIMSPGAESLYKTTALASGTAKEAEFHIAKSAAAYGATTTFGLVDDGARSTIAPINITSVYQCSVGFGSGYNSTAGAYVTAVLASGVPASVKIGDWINLVVPGETRLAYAHLCINYISPDRKTISSAARDDETTPNFAITHTPTLGAAKCYFYDQAAGANNAVLYRVNNSASSAAMLAASVDGAWSQGGTISGAHRASINSIVPAYLYGTTGEFAIRPTSRYRVVADSQSVRWGYAGEDSASIFAAVSRQSLMPRDVSMRALVRLKTAEAVSGPVARIISASHAAASATTVVTLDVTPTSAGIAVGSPVTLRGINNQTIFASSATAAAVTAIDDAAKTITLPWGAATAGSSYGGVAVLHHAVLDAQLFVTGMAQTFSYSTTDDMLTVVGNATWAGYGGIGEYVDLVGFRTSSEDPSINGAWQVAGGTGATLLLKPVYSHAGVRISPTPTITATTACSGAILLRHNTHIFGITLKSVKAKPVVEIMGQGTIDGSLAVPVYATGGIIAQGSSASIGTGGAGAWFVRSGCFRTADIAMAAITSTNTGSSVDVTGNVGSHQFACDITAVSGTSPRMVCRMQGSYDNSNWFNVYDLPVQTAAANKMANLSPAMPVQFPWVRYVRTLSGTSPSFTNSVTRTTSPGASSKRQRRLVDLVLSLTATTASTEWLYIEGCTKGQLTCTALTGATTAPAIKVQVCNGDPSVSGNWYDLTSATLATSASAMTASAIFDMPMPAQWARIVPTTAGAGVTANTYELSMQAWEA